MNICSDSNLPKFGIQLLVEILMIGENYEGIKR